MRIQSIIAIYFVIWWTILTAVLPFGNRTQAEEGTIAPGTVPSAPARPRLLMKAIATSIVAAILLGLLILVRNSGITWDDLPQFGPK